MSAATKSRVCTVLEPITATTGEIRITETVRGKLPATVEVMDTHYLVHEIPCEIGGRGFTFRKVDMGTSPWSIAEEYTCCLAGKDSTCECKGFLRWSHCKHLESLTALASRGKLPAAQAAPARDYPSLTAEAI